MIKSIGTLKTKLSKDYLGKAGIHGISGRKSENAIYVYVSGSPSVQQEKLIKKMEKEAAPYKVVTVREGRPSIRDS
jgi:hypothetical protein